MMKPVRNANSKPASKVLNSMVFRVMQQRRAFLPPPSPTLLQLTARALVAVCVSVGLPMRADGQTAKPVDFSRDVRPILAKHCYSCHGPDKQESSLRLSDFTSATSPADSGEPAITPKDKHSQLLQRVQSDSGDRMPPDGDPLKPSDIAILEKWILQGAEYSVHWAFQPIQNPAPPQVKHQEWCRNPIDQFLMEGLEQANLQPNRPAPPHELIRRLYFNMLGVPPQPHEVDTFVADPSELAYANMVERLLSDTRFGEHWARHWLDVVRYAETNSFERDGAKPNAWRYRDYVIQAFNQDKPYDQFLREQLAGDEVEAPTEESLTATGFYRLGIWDDEPADPLQAEFDGYDDIVSTTSQAMLGLTINCARCHDHKIDPILQKDYYQLVAFFRDIKPYGERGGGIANSQIEVTPPELIQEYNHWTNLIRQLEEQTKEIEQRGIVKMPAPDQRATEGHEREKVLKKKLLQHLSPEDSQLWKNKREALKLARRFLRELPARKSIMGLARNQSNPPSTQVLMRGSPHAPGDEVAPAFPALFGSPSPVIPSAAPESKSAGRRKVLADWIASDQNWLTARVIVNRIWQHHFGRGLVRSPNNFGQMGDPPTHPALLDWLATALIRNDWRMKDIHRMILTSNAYRMSSHLKDLPEEIAGLAMRDDPDNQLFWRFNMRRLSAEEIRDNVLATTGFINGELFGPSIYPRIADEVKAGQSMPGKGWEDSSESERARRSVYIHIKRSLIPPELSNFDFPETDTTCEARFLTTQAAQSLNLLNGSFMQEQSQRFAERLQRECGNDPMKQLARGLEIAWGHPARDKDIASLVELLETLQNKHGLDQAARMRFACLAMLNANAFLYLD